MDWIKIRAVARKENGYYFASPIGYIILSLFLLANGYFFTLITLRSREASMAAFFQTSVTLLLFLTPGITMRLWSEEEKNGTGELLKTSPLSSWEIVLGKYLGACFFFGVMLSSSLIYLALLFAFGKPDLGPVFSNYLGYSLEAMTFISLGLLVSTLSENQVVSMVVTWVLLVMLWVLGAAAEMIQGRWGDFLKLLSLFEHHTDFYKGVIDLTHVFYFMSLIFLGLFFSVKVLEAKRN